MYAQIDKDADPQASIMSMMKGMYDNGDDDMKVFAFLVFVFTFCS